MKLGLTPLIFRQVIRVYLPNIDIPQDIFDIVFYGTACNVP